MDQYGIGAAIRGAANIYFQSARQSGRTSSLVESVKDGDRIVFSDGREAERVRRLCLERGVKVECVVVEPPLDCRVGRLIHAAYDDDGADLSAWPSKAADEIERLREALRLSTNGLRHCSRWNISDEKEKAIMTQVISNELLLTPNFQVQRPAESGSDAT